MMLAIVAAYEKQNGIGYQGKLPWHIKEDLLNFKKLTTNKIVVMGHSTYLSIGKALPNRQNIVLSRDKKLNISDATLFHDKNEIFKLKSAADIFIIGGQDIFNIFLPYADRLYISEVQKNYKCDRFFPNINPEEFKLTSQESVDSNPPYIYKIYTRQS